MGVSVRSGDNARRSRGEPGTFRPELVGEINVPPLLVVRGEGDLPILPGLDGIRANGETGILDMERRLE